jgi:hypothetical protein
MGMSMSKADRKIAQKKAVQAMEKMINDGLNKQHKLVMIWMLHTKFGYGTQRASEALVEYENLWGCISRKELTRLTLDDIERAVADELDLYIHESGNIFYLGRGKGKKQTIKDMRLMAEKAV